MSFAKIVQKNKMTRKLFLQFLFVLSLATAAFSQVPRNVSVAILKAEDARRYDAVLEGYLASPDAEVRARAALAVGRIGDVKAIPALAKLLRDSSEKVRETAAFALGETESIEAADAVLIAIGETARPLMPNAEQANVRGRLAEAAGKIAAANAKEPKAKDLANAVLVALKAEELKGDSGNSQTIILCLTALVRTRPEGMEDAVAKMLTHKDARVRADAAGTLARARAKNANLVLRKMLYSEENPDARANAARALGAAEDKEALELLTDAAVNGDDLRVRVSAIRALISLKDGGTPAKLIAAGKPMIARLKTTKGGSERTELLEIATALGRLLEGKNDAAAIAFLKELRIADGYISTETEAAFARISPEEYLKNPIPGTIAFKNPWAASAYAQGFQTIGSSTKDPMMQAQAGIALTSFIADSGTKVARLDQAKMLTAMPDMMRALAALKPDNLEEIMRNMLTNDDVFIRAAAAEILADLPVNKENVDALNKAWSKSFIMDKVYNDAVLGILDALYKLDKKQASGALLTSLNSRDYLVRKKAFDLLKTYDAEESPGLPLMIENARGKGKDQVQPYISAFGTKLGQVLNTDIDYRRALARKNGTVKAVFTTTRGSFTIDFYPEDAPLTVDNFVKLARAGFFNGKLVHRVVANFVMQDGDNRGDGNGGPGWSIRCEVNMVPYERGSIGMALSGKDTGGSQWFATHAPQPHLDGGYTVFGKVNEAGMKVVDNIARGDKILTVRIVGR